MATKKQRLQSESQNKFLNTWGRYGTGDGEFRYPKGVAVSMNGLIYVSDTDNDRIQCFNPDGIFIRKWGYNGYRDGEFNYPMGLAIGTCDASNAANASIMEMMMTVYELSMFPPGVLPICISYIGSEYIYVCDCYNYRIQKFDLDGKFILKWGSDGNENGRFRYPYSCAIGDGLSFGADGVAEKLTSLVYVTDSQNNRVQMFDCDGKFIRSWGQKGDGDGQFLSPTAVSVSNRHGLVFITDGHNRRVQCFDVSGKFIRKWGSHGTGDGMFQWPCSLVMVDNNHDSNDDNYTSGNAVVYVIDSLNHCIKAFSLDGTFIVKIGKKGRGDGAFNYPTGIAKGGNDMNNIIYVVDSDNNRIVMLKY